MKINKIYFSIVASLLLVYACTDLEEELRGEITTDINIEGISSGGAGGGGDALSSAFIALRNAGTANHGGYFSLQALPTDEAVIAAKGGDWYDGEYSLSYTNTPLLPVTDLLTALGTNSTQELTRLTNC